MFIKIIKGTHQIGGCITEIRSQQAKIIIDYGDNLDETEQISVQGLTDEAKSSEKYDAVFITHSHSDHIGSVHKIKSGIPIYVEQKSMQIHNTLCEFMNQYDKKIRPEQNPNIYFFEFEKKYVIKDIAVTPYIVDHSCYNSAMFLIEAEGVRILHTGDYRNHGKKGKIFDAVLKKIGKVDVLITEGTTLTRQGEQFKKEQMLSNDLKETLKYDQIYFMCSSTNIDRIVTLYKAFCPTHLFIEDLCMNSIAIQLDNIPNSNTFSNVQTFINSNQKVRKEPCQRYINHTKNIIEEIPWDKKFAFSLKLSSYEYIRKNKEKIKNACLIYSMWDGYIREDWKDSKTREFVKYLTDEVGMQFFFIHTSGHADKKAMMQLYQITKPKKVIVIHTDDKNESLKNAQEIFGKSLCQIEDFESLVIEKQKEEPIQNRIRKYINDGKKYIIRIREKEGDIVYYNGIKILELSKNNLKINDALFQFNEESFKKVIEKVKREELENREEKVKEYLLKQMQQMRLDMMEEGRLKVVPDCYVKIKRSYKEGFLKIQRLGLDNILGYLKPYDVDIEYVKEYKLKNRKKLAGKFQEEIQNLVIKQKEKIEEMLGEKIKFSIVYSDSRGKTKIYEEELESKNKSVKEIEENWNKSYVLSYTIDSCKELGKKQEIQKIMCDDQIFEDWNEQLKKWGKEEKENSQFEDFVFYRINSYQNISEIAHIEYGIIRNRIFDENLEYVELFIPSFHTVEAEKLRIDEFRNFSEIDKLTKQMEDKVKKYVEFVKDGVEKHYQFQFMIQDFAKKKLKHAILTCTGKNGANELYQTIYPFEQEYFILNKKGRIDAIFFDIKENRHADLYLIEVKVNEAVIGSNNGVHKHLADIHQLLGRERQEFLEKIKRCLDYRRRELLEEEVDTIDKVHFWTIIGYTMEENHKLVIEELLKVYYHHGSECGEELKDLKRRYPLLKGKDISIPSNSRPLKEYMEELNKLYDCDVKFFFDSLERTKGDYRITDCELELFSFDD